MPDQSPGMCEVCYEQFGPDDLSDGVTVPADCCGRCGLCASCREFANHDCDIPASSLAARSQPAEVADVPDGVSMVVLDPGHDYLVRSLDGGQPIRITFVKREGSHYPGNVGHYGGTIIQRLAEVIEDRLAYVNSQIPCWESEMAQGLARALKAVLEVRAARTHGRHLEFATVAEFMAALPCTKCGHTGCTRHESLPTPPVPQEPSNA